MRAIAEKAAPARAPRGERAAATAWQAPASGALELQRRVGNRAVAQLLGPVLRRACACGGRSGAEPCAGCAEHEEDEEALRRTASALDVVSLRPDVRAYLSRSQGGGRPLEGPVRHSLERSFGRGLGGVRVHSGSEAAWAARSLRARAFALGNDIWFGADEYRPEDGAGRRLLAHEVAHTLEQHVPAFPGSVRVGSASDPAEARADRAADAVLRSLPAPAPARSESAIRRYAIARVDPVEEGGEQVVNVDLDNGIRYRVRRVCSVVPEERTVVGWRPPRVTAGADRENVWVELTWCTGTRGRITAGADVPEQFRQAVQRVIQGALAGRSPDAVLRETTLNPFVDFAIAQSGGIAVEGRVQVTVGGDGVQAGEGSLTLRHGAFDVGVTGRGGGDGGFEVGLTLTFTPGRSSETFDCPTTSRRRERYTRVCAFECTHGPINPPPRPAEPPPTAEHETATVYFAYRESTPNRTLNDPEAARLTGLLREGYRVQAIRGFASPEGPLERRSERFQGNRTLSRQRAEAAAAQVARLAGDAGVAGPGLVSADVPVVGCGERLGGAPECEPLAEGQARSEREGRAVAREAVREFLADPAEMARLTDADRAALDRARSDEDRARIIYPYLRRASVDLVRTVERPRSPVDITLRPLPLDYFDCPQDVVEAARPHLERRRQPGPRR